MESDGSTAGVGVTRCSHFDYPPSDWQENLIEIAAMIGHCRRSEFAQSPILLSFLHRLVLRVRNFVHCELHHEVIPRRSNHAPVVTLIQNGQSQLSIEYIYDSRITPNK